MKLLQISTEYTKLLLAAKENPRNHGDLINGMSTGLTLPNEFNMPTTANTRPSPILKPF